MDVQEKKAYLGKYIITQHAIKRLRKQISIYGECEEYTVQYEKYRAMLNKMRDEVELIPDELLREVLIQKYFMGNTLGETASMLKYSRRQIERLHRRALEEFNTL